jgi:hypothetical protein
VFWLNGFRHRCLISPYLPVLWLFHVLFMYPQLCDHRTMNLSLLYPSLADPASSLRLFLPLWSRRLFQSDLQSPITRLHVILIQASPFMLRSLAVLQVMSHWRATLFLGLRKSQTPILVLWSYLVEDIYITQ